MCIKKNRSWNKAGVNMRRIILLLACISTSLMIMACSSSPSSHTFNIQVSPTKELAKTYGYYPSFEVDVAALSQEDAIRISKYPLDKYFEPSSGIREYLEPVTLHFSERDLTVKTIDGDSDEFKKLMSRDPSHLVLIVNLPYAPKDATLDPRKYIYKLPEGMFSVAKDMFIKVGSTGLIRTTSIDAQNSLPAAPETEKQPVVIDLNCVSEKGKKDMRCKQKTELKDPANTKQEK